MLWLALSLPNLEFSIIDDCEPTCIGEWYPELSLRLSDESPIPWQLAFALLY